MSNQKILFPSLPLELREQIYAEILFPLITWRDARRIFVGSDIDIHPPTHPFWLPKLCEINETMRIEVGLFFIRNAEFYLNNTDSASYLVEFLESFPGDEGLESVRRLRFRLRPDNVRESGAVTLADTELLAHCTKLTQLRLVFPVHDVVKGHKFGFRHVYSGTQFGPIVLTLDELLHTIGRDLLDEVFASGSLNRIVLEIGETVIVGEDFKALIGRELDFLPLATELKEWMLEEFAKRGRRVQILVEKNADLGGGSMRWLMGRLVYVSGVHVG